MCPPYLFTLNLFLFCSLKIKMVMLFLSHQHKFKNLYKNEVFDDCSAIIICLWLSCEHILYLSLNTREHKGLKSGYSPAEAGRFNHTFCRGSSAKIRKVLPNMTKTEKLPLTRCTLVGGH